MHSRDKTQRDRRFVDRVIARLTEPLIPVSDPLVRRRMQILASLMMILILLPLSTLAVAPFTGSQTSPVLYYFLAGLLAVMALLYYLSRTRWHSVTAFILVIAASSSPFVALINGKSYEVRHIEAALITDRPYRKASSEEEVIAYLRKEAGHLFDPHLVELFLDILKKNK